MAKPTRIGRTKKNAAYKEEFKERVLICLLEKLGGKVTLTATEINKCEGRTVRMEIQNSPVQVEPTFEFKVAKVFNRR